jgi:D-threo-aldose 1-dehydrogenase
MGGEFFDYRLVDPVKDKDLFDWRDRFQALCKKHNVKPYEACVQFGMQLDGVVATALNTTKPHRIPGNIDAVSAEIPHEFWQEAQHIGLIKDYYPIPTLA